MTPNTACCSPTWATYRRKRSTRSASPDRESVDEGGVEDLVVGADEECLWVRDRDRRLVVERVDALTEEAGAADVVVGGPLEVAAPGQRHQAVVVPRRAAVGIGADAAHAHVGAARSRHSSPVRSVEALSATSSSRSTSWARMDAAACSR